MVGGGDRSSSSSFGMSQAAPPSPSSDHCGDNCDNDNDNRVAVDFFDFFSDRHQKTTTDSVNIKNENSHEEASNINIGLQLFTANTGSDQSTVDDGVSSDMEDKRGKSNTAELAQGQVELQKMNLESQKPSQVASIQLAFPMLLQTLMQQQQQVFSQVASIQLALQMQHLTLMQQQQQNQIVEGGKLSDDKKPELMVPRQFLDLGPSAATAEIDHEVSNNISTPPNKTEIASLDQENFSFRNGKRINREESQGGPNKAQKLNNSMAPTKSIDQSSAEATMGPISHQLGGHQFTPPPPPSLHPPQSSSVADTVSAATISSFLGNANNPVTTYPISITGCTINSFNTNSNNDTPTTTQKLDKVNNSSSLVATPTRMLSSKTVATTDTSSKAEQAQMQSKQCVAIQSNSQPPADLHVMVNNPRANRRS